ncbi:MAG: hypothetical protein KAR40_14030 [Candidatus Sabulitectum sp.]|nr:hypothetical protein [Candidatus Sabulitectum sp.]
MLDVLLKCIDNLAIGGELTQNEIEKMKDMAVKLHDKHQTEQAACASGSAGATLLAAKESGEGQELNKGHYHEIIDRSHLICSMIDDFVIGHPGMTTEMNELCREAQSRLCKVTNLACGEEDRNFGS